MGSFLDMAGSPRELISTLFAIVSIVQLCIIAAVVGIVGTFIGRWCLTATARRWLLPIWLIGASAFLSSWWLIAAPREQFALLLAVDLRRDAGPMHIAIRASALLLAGLTTFVMTQAIWQGARGGRSPHRMQPLAQVIALGVACLVISLVAMLWIRPNRFMAVETVLASQFASAALTALIGINAATAALALAANGRHHRALTSVILLTTPIAAIGGFWLFQVAVGASEWAIVAGGLGIDFRADPTPTRLWWQWCAGYGGVVLLLGLGATIALRMVPALPVVNAPKRRSRSAYHPVPSVINNSPESSCTSNAIQPPPASFPQRHHYVLLACLGSAFAVYASLVPFEFQPLNWTDAISSFRQVPYLDLEVFRRADWMANLALFVPLGLLWSASVWSGRPRRPTTVAVGITTIVPILTVLIVAIEFAQLWCPKRTVSQNDMIAEALGAAMGLGVWFVAGHWLTEALRAISTSRGPVARSRFLQLYGFAVLLYLFQPFDFTFNAANLAEKFKLARVTLNPFAGPYDLGRAAGIIKQMVLFAPIGVLLRVRWKDLNPPRSVSTAAAAAVLLAATIEIVQLFIFSAVVETEDAVGAGLGGLIGAIMATRLFSPEGTVMMGRTLGAPIRRTIAMALTGAYAVALAGLLWRPLAFEWDPSLFTQRLGSFINPPFRYYYYSGEWQALVKVTLCMALFIPFGAVWRWAQAGRSHRSSKLRLFLAALAVGLALEAGQALVVRDTVYLTPDEVETGRYSSLHQSVDVTDPSLSKGMMLLKGPTPDITDAVAYLMGTAIGWIVAGVFLPQHRNDL